MTRFHIAAPALTGLALLTAACAPPPVDDGIPDVVSRENMPAYCKGQVAKTTGADISTVSALPSEAGGAGFLVFAEVPGGDAAGLYDCSFAGDGTFRGVTKSG